MGDLFPPAQRGAYGDWEPRRHVNRTAVAWYDYTDEWGVVLYQKVRYEPKDFRLRRPDGAGGWRWNAEGVRRVLFRLPALLADPRQPVIVVEGEKDVLAAEGLGLLATTSVEGAGAGWDDDTYPVQLRGRRVVVIPDHDATGLAHAERIVGALLRPRPEWGGPGVAGVAGVRLVELPGLGPHGDLADWVQAGGTREELIGIIRAAPEWLPKGQRGG